MRFRIETCLVGADNAVFIRMLRCGWFSKVEYNLPNNKKKGTFEAVFINTLKAF